jgi:hypothetical protein
MFRASWHWPNLRYGKMTIEARCGKRIIDRNNSRNTGTYGATLDSEITYCRDRRMKRQHFDDCIERLFLCW